MKKTKLLNLILICAVAFSLIIFTKALCEDEDSGFDILCNIGEFFHYKALLASVLPYAGILYEGQSFTISAKSIMAYLERQEKSPPGNSTVFRTA